MQVRLSRLLGGLGPLLRTATDDFDFEESRLSQSICAFSLPMVTNIRLPLLLQANNRRYPVLTLTLVDLPGTTRVSCLSAKLLTVHHSPSLL